MTDRLREWAGLLTRPTGPPPRPTRLGQAFDVVLALVVGASAVWYVLDNMTGLVEPGDRGLSPVAPGEWIGPVIVAVVASAPLALRRRWWTRRCFNG